MRHPQTNKFITSRHVKFNEKIVYGDLESRLFGTREHSESEASKDTSIPAPEINTGSITKLQNNKPTKRKNQESVFTNTKVQKMLERKAKIDPKRDPNFVYKVQCNESEMEENSEEIHLQIYALIAAINNDPTNYREASESKDTDKWLMAVNSIAPPNHNSTCAVADPENQVSGDTLQLNVTANETFDGMNNSIDKLQHTLKSNLQKEVAIKGDYKLTNKSNFNTWLDFLNSELASNDLKEIIDQQGKFSRYNRLENSGPGKSFGIEST